MEVSNGWLKEEEKVKAILNLGKPTKHFYDLHSNQPLGVCWHYSNPVWSNCQNAKQVCELLLRDYADASWHCMLGKDGMLYQCVSFNKGSWHVGKPGTVKGQYVDNVNRYLIGIEVENEGHLQKIDGELYSWPWRREPSLKSEGVLIEQGEFKNHYFAPFTNEQINCARQLISALKETYNFVREDFMYQHHQFDPDRKDDIGPLWMNKILPSLLNEIFI